MMTPSSITTFILTTVPIHKVMEDLLEVVQKFTIDANEVDRAKIGQRNHHLTKYLMRPFYFSCANVFKTLYPHLTEDNYQQFLDKLGEGVQDIAEIENACEMPDDSLPRAFRFSLFVYISYSEDKNNKYKLKIVE